MWKFRWHNLLFGVLNLIRLDFDIATKRGIAYLDRVTPEEREDALKYGEHYVWNFGKYIEDLGEPKPNVYMILRNYRLLDLYTTVEPDTSTIKMKQKNREIKRKYKHEKRLREIGKLSNI